jgi:hypothetical protein
MKGGGWRKDVLRTLELMASCEEESGMYAHGISERFP